MASRCWTTSGAPPPRRRRPPEAQGVRPSGWIGGAWGARKRPGGTVPGGAHDRQGSPRTALARGAVPHAGGPVGRSQDTPMAWRERFLQTVGPGIFAGITSGDWLSLLRENRFAIDPP